MSLSQISLAKSGISVIMRYLLDFPDFILLEGKLEGNKPTPFFVDW